MAEKSYKNIAILVLVILAGFILYGNSLNNPFIWDDQYLITDNHFVKSFKYLSDIFTHQLYYSTGGVSNFYRPLQSLFVMLDYSIWKERPFGYHLTSLLFHIGCAVLIYLIINSLFKYKSIAFFVSLLFLIHPANSTVVDYISSRADSQAAFFVLLSFFCFMEYIFLASKTPPKQQKGHHKQEAVPKHQKILKKIYYFGSSMAFILALLSKELGIICLPLILVSIPIIFDANKKFIFRKTVPLFITFIIYFLLRMTVLNFQGPEVTVHPPSLYLRLLTTAESFIRLMGIMFAPFQIHIEKTIPFSKGIMQPSTIISVAALLCIFVFMFRVRRFSKMCLWGLSWFFIGLLPMANIVPINTTLADHWLYLPGFGFILAIVGLAYDVTKKIDPRASRAVTVVFTCLYVMIIALFSFLTAKQNTVWSDPIKFYRHAIKYSPKSFRPHNEIGIIYLSQKKFDEAIVEFKEAIKLSPNFDQAYDNLGTAYDQKGDLENAVASHKKAIEINPENIKAYNNLGNAYNNANRFDEALEAYKNALKLNPSYKALYNNIGVVYYKKGMFKEARYYWEQALKIDPNFQMAQNNLKVLDQMGK